MTARTHSSELLRASWGCERCNAGGNADNAQGLAAQHHDKKHHRTWVEITRRFVYGAVSGKSAQGEQKGFI